MGCGWLQAMFLRGSSSGGDETELAAELNALSSDELDTRCRRNGLSRRYAPMASGFGFADIFIMRSMVQIQTTGSNHRVTNIIQGLTGW